MSLQSCSDDLTEQGQITSAPSSTVSAKLNITNQATAVSQFKNLVLTSDWTNFDNAAKTWGTKMKNSPVFLTTRAQYITWINANLSSTNFTSVTEFTTLYDDMVTKGQTLVSNNSTFFNHLMNADELQVKEIMYPLIDGRVPISSDPCVIALGINVGVAYGHLSQNLSACLITFQGDLAGFCTCYASAQGVFANEFQAALTTYANC